MDTHLVSYSFCVYVFVLFGYGVLGLGFLSSLPLQLIVLYTCFSCTFISVFIKVFINFQGFIYLFFVTFLN